MDINALLDKAAEDFAAAALARYDAFLAANAKPLTMAERVKSVVRPTPISFEAYLELCFAAIKATPVRCSFVARPRGRQPERAPFGMIRWPSPSGDCEEEDDDGRHDCYHPSFKPVGYCRGYGTHYSKTYDMKTVERLHKEDVRRRAMSSAYDIDFS